MLKGMAYVHSSPINLHGNLTSAKCLIDSRWVCKVTEFGTKKFTEGEEIKLSEEAKFAGEILRGKKPFRMIILKYMYLEKIVIVIAIAISSPRKKLNQGEHKSAG